MRSGLIERLERQSLETVIEETLACLRRPPKFERLADLRYVGQGFELVVALPKGPYKSRVARRQDTPRLL